VAVPGAAAIHRVALHTNLGVIELEIQADKAPKSAANFLTYARDGFYGGTIFHRVIPGFMVQGGGFTPDHVEKPARPPVPNEAGNGLKNERGTIAMARTNDPHSAAAQFFINVANNEMLNHVAPTDSRSWGYAVFGRVTKGMEIVDKIVALPTGPGGPFDTDVPKPTVTIERAEILAD
jgi:peptidyl-prolyl cis-trans isomerase A (cyclophilin A)/peptidyl-prolyl cis-trans isomerase B (cyclophilin B)